LDDLDLQADLERQPCGSDRFRQNLQGGHFLRAVQT
jgi:hypothetical protein